MDLRASATADSQPAVSPAASAALACSSMIAKCACFVQGLRIGRAGGLADGGGGRLMVQFRVDAFVRAKSAAA